MYAIRSYYEMIVQTTGPSEKANEAMKTISPTIVMMPTIDVPAPVSAVDWVAKPSATAHSETNIPISPMKSNGRRPKRSM